MRDIEFDKPVKVLTGGSPARALAVYPARTTWAAPSSSIATPKSGYWPASRKSRTPAERHGAEASCATADPGVMARVRHLKGE